MFQRLVQNILNIPEINQLANIVERDLLTAPSSVFRSTLYKYPRNEPTTITIPPPRFDENGRNTQNSSERTKNDRVMGGRERVMNDKVIKEDLMTDMMNAVSHVMNDMSDPGSEDEGEDFFGQEVNYEDMSFMVQVDPEEERERMKRKRQREEQDREFEESLMRDSEKEEQRCLIEEMKNREEIMRLEEKRKKEVEEDEMELQKAIEFSKQLIEERERIERLQSIKLPEEPSLNQKDVISLVVMVPPFGVKLERNFYLSNTLQDVRNFIDIHSLDENSSIPIPERYLLVTDFPRQVWDDVNLKLSQTPFCRRILLRVEPC